jgi:hypothetical protein
MASDGPAEGGGRYLTEGHAHALEAVSRAVRTERPPHALLLVGPRGVGKTTLALDLSAGLLCLEPDPVDRPCRSCTACRKVELGVHPDLHLIEPDGAGEQIRLGQVQRLTAELSLTPLEGRFRVAVISSAHRLNPDARMRCSRARRPVTTCLIFARMTWRCCDRGLTRPPRLGAGGGAVTLAVGRGDADPGLARAIAIASGADRGWPSGSPRGPTRSCPEPASVGPARPVIAGRRTAGAAADLSPTAAVDAVPGAVAPSATRSSPPSCAASPHRYLATSGATYSAATVPMVSATTSTSRSLWRSRIGDHPRLRYRSPRRAHARHRGCQSELTLDVLLLSSRGPRPRAMTGRHRPRRLGHRRWLRPECFAGSSARPRARPQWLVPVRRSAEVVAEEPMRTSTCRPRCGNAGAAVSGRRHFEPARGGFATSGPAAPPRR